MTRTTSDSGRVRFGDLWQEGFWAAVDRGEVVVQRCSNGHHQFPGGPRCVRCGTETVWVPVSGDAAVWSWAVFHHEYFPEFATALPYTVMIVTLDEGPRVYAGLHPEETVRPEIGMRVRLEVTESVFRPVPLARLTI